METPNFIGPLTEVQQQGIEATRRILDEIGFRHNEVSDQDVFAATQNVRVEYDLCSPEGADTLPWAESDKVGEETAAFIGMVRDGQQIDLTEVHRLANGTYVRVKN
jgi:hypothetical protein